MYSVWSDEIVFSQGAFRSTALGEIIDLGMVYAVDGLPQEFTDELIKASQVVDVPHTWRVRQVADVSEVGKSDLKLGREVLAVDVAELGANIICYLAKAEGEFRFVAAGAIRSKLNRNFESIRYPVVSRAVVHPELRGRGIGSMIVEHRLTAALTYFGERPNAIHFATESPQILAAADRFAAKNGQHYIKLGSESLEVVDGTHKVDDYLFVLPRYQKLLSDCAAELQSAEVMAHDFQHRFRLFLEQGIEGASGDALKQELLEVDEPTYSRHIDTLSEFFVVRDNIGASDH